jgi:hypothetical protein
MHDALSVGSNSGVVLHYASAVPTISVRMCADERLECVRRTVISLVCTATGRTSLACGACLRTFELALLLHWKAHWFSDWL